MKRLIVLLATLLLSFGLTYAAPGGVGALQVKASAGDTVWINQPAAFDFWIANDVKMGGFQLPLLVTASGGAAWTWNTQPTGYGDDPTTQYFTVTAGGRMDPPATIWSLTSGFITNMTQAPAKILIGGTAGSQPTAGSPLGPLASAFKAHFTATLADEGVVGEICIDRNTTVGPAAFVFSNMTGGAFITMTYPGSIPATPGKWCFPVKKMPNMCPTFVSGPSAINGPHCGVATGTYVGTDTEQNTLTWDYELVSGAGSVTLAGGVLTYDFAASEISGVVAQIDVYLSDNMHAPRACAVKTVMVTANNNPPTVNCGGAYHTIPINQLFTKSDIVGGDVDVTCDDVTYSIVGPGAIDPVTGVYTWTPVEAEVGLHTVTVTVTDGAATAECSFQMNVVSFTGIQVIIEKTEGTLQGHYEKVNVSFGKATNDVGGFDLLIGYDASGLNFVEAELSADLKACGWEYFTYRYNWNGNCGNGCPSGLLRLIGLAETNNGPAHPDAQCLSALQNKGIATLTFLVSNDRNLECQYLPVRFYWMDCTDNTLSDLTGDTLYMARDIYNFDDNPLDPTMAINYGIDVTEDSYFWPGYYGWAAECWPVAGPLHPDIKQLPLEYVDFIDGGIDVICADSIDARGDINLNGIANEVADAVMFTNYFILGLTAFGDTPEGSIAASDVNADGISLSVADLVYLIRVIVGDALPYAKPVPGSSFAVSTQVLNGQMTVDYTASNDAGAVLLVFNVNGTVGTPVLGSDVKMDIASGTNGNELRVLVYNIGPNAIPAGTNELLTIPVSGSVELVSVEAADFNGGAMEASTRVLPSEFGLNQNYPNPFNPKTVISFNLPTASNWNLAIYNVAGQMVKQYNDYSEAGSFNVTWDGTDNNGSSVASGIYFYKMTASNFSATKKMVLMK